MVRRTSKTKVTYISPLLKVMGIFCVKYVNSFFYLANLLYICDVKKELNK